MAPTSEERREVAARLRFFARETNGTSDFSMYLGHWVNADEEQVGNPFTVQANRKSAERTLEKLADLIDPTCHIAPDDLASEQCMGPMLSCDRCGAAFPHINDDYNYCPACGARCVDNGGGES